MKASEVMVSVKRWFSLRNYDVLQKITAGDLSDEINRRASLLRYDFDYGNDTRRLDVWSMKPGYWRAIPFWSVPRQKHQRPGKSILSLTPAFMSGISRSLILVAMKPGCVNWIYSGAVMARQDPSRKRMADAG